MNTERGGVSIVVLAMNSYVHFLTMLQILNAITLSKRAIDVQVIDQTMPIDYAREKAADVFLSSASTWFVGLDHDVAPQRFDWLSVIDEMEATGKKIAALPTPTVIDGAPRLNVFDERDYPLATIPPGWSRCAAFGTGCYVVHRSVFAALTRPYFKVLDQQQPVGRWNTPCEDLHFCRAARAAGFSLWVKPDYSCYHFKTVPLFLGNATRAGYQVPTQSK